MSNDFVEYLKQSKKSKIREMQETWDNAKDNLYLEIRLWLKDALEQELINMDISTNTEYQLMTLSTNEDNMVFFQEYRKLSESECGTFQVYYANKIYYLEFCLTNQKWTYYKSGEYMPDKIELSEDSFIELLKEYF